MENIHQFLQSFTNSVLFYEASLITIVTLVGVFLCKFSTERILQHLRGSRRFWLKSTLKSAKSPLISFILLYGGVCFIDSFDNNLELHLVDDFSVFRKLVAILTTSWFAFNLIGIVEETYLLKRNENSKIDQGTADALTKTARIIVVIVVSLLSMQTLGFSISALVAFAGGGGVVAGFAAKDMLSNFFGALSIYLDKPFVVGDWIRSPDKEIEGIVERIGLRITKIRTLEKRPLFVQNAIFNTLSIENVTNMSHRRVKEKIGLTHNNLKNLNKVTIAIEEMLKQHPDVDQEMFMVINLESFDITSATLLLMTFTKKVAFVDFCKFRQDILLKISDIVEQEGCQLAQLHPALKVAAEMK